MRFAEIMENYEDTTWVQAIRKMKTRSNSVALLHLVKLYHNRALAKIHFTKPK
jgi:hypothetical protein